MEDIIAVHQLSKKYPSSEDYALKDVNLSIPKGAIFGLLGPNGAGKTTLLSVLCGLVKPSAGAFSVAEASGDQTKKIQRLIGIVPQEYALYPTLTAFENLLYFGSLYDIPRKELHSRIEDSLTQLGLIDYAHRKINTFSGGMKRRVNLIAGLLHRPEVLFLDEPTVGVDVQSRSHIIAFLRKLNTEGMTIVYTSHLMAEAEDFCTDISIIDQGKIIVSGRPTELIAADSDTHSLETLFLSITGKQLRDV